MDTFKVFLENEREDVHKALAKLPKGHQKLAHGFEMKFEPNHTLKGDDKHIGEIAIGKKQKRIRVSSPWNYGREFALFHEIAHLVWEHYVKGTSLEKQWAEITHRTPNKKDDEPPEELFCHAYANAYIKFPLVIHSHPDWMTFIKNLPQ